MGYVKDGETTTAQKTVIAVAVLKRERSFFNLSIPTTLFTWIFKGIALFFDKIHPGTYGGPHGL